jgi:eukaryotic-like serine/threonine-protein kinase
MLWSAIGFGTLGMAVIDRDRWRKLEPLLDHALELSDVERAAWLSELRAQSPELAAELASLLGRESAANRQGFLDAPLDGSIVDPARARMDLGAYLQTAFGDAYTIERELGGGGMGRVFVAREQALERTVVIKVLLPVVAAGIRAERFAREVRVIAALQHPNIVPLFRAGEAAGLPYYVMPYVRGESLRARLTRDGRLPLTDALSVLRDVARALAFAHEQGVVHRDVKPENVLLAGDAAVMTDFGIAKAISSAAESAENQPNDGTLSAVGSAIGTPAYMAPEQATGDPRVDHRADLYAWGVLAYELLAGAHPFAGRTTSHDLLAAHLSATPAALSDVAPETSPAITTLVMRCLEKDPARRPQSAREIVEGLATIVTPATTDPALTPHAHRKVSRLTMVSAGLLAIVLVASIATALLRNRSSASSAAAPFSLAVLPFEAIGGDTANAYLGEGIADEIAIALSKAAGLRVASRTSAAAFRSGHDADVREIGRRLGVSTVLEGRVRRAQDRMRLTVQLTSVGDGMTLWSDEYERQVTDVFRVQDEIARAIVAALRARLRGIDMPQPGVPLASPGTSNAEAYDLYLRGSYLLERRGSGVAKAVEYFERAIAEDSTFARAYAGLSYGLELMPNFTGTFPRSVEARSTQAAQHALALDPTLAEAYTALAMAHMYALRWREADEAFQRGIAVNAGFAPGQYLYGLYLLRVGRLDDAEAHLRHARLDDPLSVTASGLLAYGLSLNGKYDESVAESRRAFDLDSTSAAARTLVPLALLIDGRRDEARAIARVAFPEPFNGMGAYVLGATGDSASAAAVVRALERRPRDEWSVATSLIYSYLGLGDTSRALSAMEDAARQHERPHITWIDPMFDPVRRSPRFAAVIRSLGLDDRPFTTARALHRAR